MLASARACVVLSCDGVADVGVVSRVRGAGRRTEGESDEAAAATAGTSAEPVLQPTAEPRTRGMLGPRIKALAVLESGRVAGRSRVGAGGSAAEK